LILEDFDAAQQDGRAKAAMRNQYIARRAEELRDLIAED